MAGRKRKIPTTYKLRPWYQGEISSDSDDNLSPPLRTPILPQHRPNVVDSDPPSAPASSVSQSGASLPSSGDIPSSDNDDPARTTPQHQRRYSSQSDLSRGAVPHLTDDEVDPNEATRVQHTDSGDDVVAASDKTESDSDIEYFNEIGRRGVPQEPMDVHNDEEDPERNDDDDPEVFLDDDEDDDDEDDDHNEDDDDDESFENTNTDATDFKDLFEEVCSDWLTLELDHHVSKTASNSFWSLACSKMVKLFELKKLENITRKVPQFKQIRRKRLTKTPKIKMEIGYIDKSTGELTVEEDLVNTPVKMYPVSQFQKAYEIASIKVSLGTFLPKT